MRASLCIAIAAIAAMNQISGSEKSMPKLAVQGVSVRYIVSDVDRAVAFYTNQLRLKLEQRQGPAFAIVSQNGLRLWLSGPGSSGARDLPGGKPQRPGGSNRLALELDDLATKVEAMKKAGFRFRNNLEVGPGGKQIQVLDPDDNPIELFEAAKR